MYASQLHRIYTIHRFFSLKKRASISVLSHRLNVSRSALFRDLEELKDIGAPLDYCAFSRKHYYHTHFQMSFEEFFKKVT